MYSFFSECSKTINQLAIQGTSALKATINEPIVNERLQALNVNRRKEKLVKWFGEMKSNEKVAAVQESSIQLASNTISSISNTITRLRSDFQENLKRQQEHEQVIQNQANTDGNSAGPLDGDDNFDALSEFSKDESLEDLGRDEGTFNHHQRLISLSDVSMNDQDDNHRNDTQILRHLSPIPLDDQEENIIRPNICKICKVEVDMEHIDRVIGHVTMHYPMLEIVECPACPFHHSAGRMVTLHIHNEHKLIDPRKTKECLIVTLINYDKAVNYLFPRNPELPAILKEYFCEKRARGIRRAKVEVVKPDEGITKCKICQEKIKRNSGKEILQHLLIEHVYEAPYLCKCGFKAALYPAIENHLKVPHPDPLSAQFVDNRSEQVWTSWKEEIEKCFPMSTHDLLGQMQKSGPKRTKIILKFGEEDFDGPLQKMPKYN